MVTAEAQGRYPNTLAIMGSGGTKAHSGIDSNSIVSVGLYAHITLPAYAEVASTLRML